MKSYGRLTSYGKAAKVRNRISNLTSENSKYSICRSSSDARNGEGGEYRERTDLLHGLAREKEGNSGNIGNND